MRSKIAASLIGLVLVFVTGLLPATPVHSEVPSVRLKESVDVAYGPLSLKHLVVGDLSGTNYTLELGSLPSPGNVKFVSRAYIMMMAQNQDKEVPKFDGEQIRTRVRRPARTIDRDELKKKMESVIRKKLSQQANLKVSAQNIPETLEILPGPYQVMVDSPGVYQSERGSVWYRFSIRQKERTIRSFRTKVHVSQYRDVPVAVRKLERGTILQPEMIEWRKRKINRLRGNIALAPEDVVGYELTRNVRADKVIRGDVLRKPIVIERREMVTIRYRTGGVTITTPGESLEEGAVGDEVRVENTSSEQEIVAEVINEQLVEVNRAIRKEGN